MRLLLILATCLLGLATSSPNLRLFSNGALVPEDTPEVTEARELQLSALEAATEDELLDNDYTSGYERQAPRVRPGP